jgi:hypothetical protein
MTFTTALLSPTRLRSLSNISRTIVSGLIATVLLLAALAAIDVRPAAAATQPDATNTGVPAGTTLRVVNGDYKITAPGTYSTLDIHGFVTVQANNVTITNSVVRGRSTTNEVGLINNIFGNTGLIVKYTTLVPTYPAPGIDGVKGWNYTLDHVNIRGTTDGAKIYGNNVVIKYSYIHDLKYFTSDPSQGGKPTHNDGVQVLGGRYITITTNTIRAATSYNSALQVTQTKGSASGLVFTYNWAGGGACTLNITAKPLTSMSGVNLSYNHFYNDSKYGCSMIIDKSVSYTASGNTMISTTAAPKTVRR